MGSRPCLRDVLARTAVPRGAREPGLEADRRAIASAAGGECVARGGRGSRRLRGACSLGKTRGCLGKVHRQDPDAEATGGPRRGVVPSANVLT
jgi:hypothetical protein